MKIVTCSHFVCFVNQNNILLKKCFCDSHTSSPPQGSWGKQALVSPGGNSEAGSVGKRSNVEKLLSEQQVTHTPLCTMNNHSLFSLPTVLSAHLCSPASSKEVFPQAFITVSSLQERSKQREKNLHSGLRKKSSNRSSQNSQSQVYPETLMAVQSPYSVAYLRGLEIPLDPATVLQPHQLLLNLGQNLNCVSEHTAIQQCLLSLLTPHLDLKSTTKRQFIPPMNSRHWECKQEQNRESLSLMYVCIPMGQTYN